MSRITISRDGWNALGACAIAGLVALALAFIISGATEHHAPPHSLTKPLIHKVVYQNSVSGNDLTCKGKLHSRPCASVPKACSLARPTYFIYETGQSPPRKSYRAACTSLPPLGSANVFVSATGSDTGANCVLFATARTNPDTSGASLCKTPDKAYKLARSGDVIEAECNGNFVGDDFAVNYDSTKNFTQYVTFRPNPSCPTGALGQPQWSLGQHTVSTAQFTMQTGVSTNTIPVSSTAGFKIPGKVYIGWDTWGNCTGTQTTPTIAFTGCTYAGSSLSIVWNSGTDIKQGLFSVVGASYLDVEDLNANYNISIDQTHPSGQSCPQMSLNPHAANHVIFDGITSTRFGENGGDSNTIRNSQFGPDNSTNNAKLQFYCRDSATSPPLCGQAGNAGTCVYTANNLTLLDNVHFKDMSDTACNIAATNAAFPAQGPGNNFCHNECLYLSDSTNLLINAAFFDGCAIMDLFCSDDKGIGINLTLQNSILAPMKWNPSNTINCHTDHAGLLISQKFINNDISGSGVIFQSGSGGKIDLVWANNAGNSPGCTSVTFNSVVFTNNVTFGGSSPSCAVNNALSTAAAEWTDATGGDYTLLSGAASVDHGSSTYAPLTDKLGFTRCGPSPDTGPLEKCATVTGASLASCTGTCTAPTYVPDATSVGCSLSGSSTVVNSTAHVVTFVPISNGTVTECRQIGYAYSPELNITGGSHPAAFFIAENPSPNSTCGSGGNSDIKDTYNAWDLAPVAASGKFVIIVVAKPCNSARSPSNWYHRNIDIPLDSSPLSDGPYLAAAVSWAESALNVDPNRIYLGGSSSAGGLVSGIACDPTYSTLFRGYVSEAYMMSVTGNTTTGPNANTEVCPSTNTSFFYMDVSGTADTQVPPSGTCLTSHCLSSFDENRRWWAQHMGCGATAIHTMIGTPASNDDYSYSLCAFGTPAKTVKTNLVAGGAHGSNAVTATTYGGACTVCSDYFLGREAWAYFHDSSWAP